MISPEIDSIEPVRTDFLCGIRNECILHPGTSFVKEDCIEPKVERYHEAEKTTKMQINVEIVLQVYARQGRFLVKNSKTKQWEKLSFVDARRRVGLIFSNLVRNLRKERAARERKSEITLPPATVSQLAPPAQVIPVDKSYPRVLVQQNHTGKHVGVNVSPASVTIPVATDSALQQNQMLPPPAVRTVQYVSPPGVALRQSSVSPPGVALRQSSVEKSVVAQKQNQQLTTNLDSVPPGSHVVIGVQPLHVGQTAVSLASGQQMQVTTLPTNTRYLMATSAANGLGPVQARAAVERAARYNVVDESLGPSPQPPVAPRPHIAPGRVAGENHLSDTSGQQPTLGGGGRAASVYPIGQLHALGVRPMPVHGNLTGVGQALANPRQQHQQTPTFVRRHPHSRNHSVDDISFQASTFSDAISMDRFLDGTSQVDSAHWSKITKGTAAACDAIKTDMVGEIVQSVTVAKPRPDHRLNVPKESLVVATQNEDLSRGLAAVEESRFVAADIDDEFDNMETSTRHAMSAIRFGEVKDHILEISSFPMSEATLIDDVDWAETVIMESVGGGSSRATSLLRRNDGAGIKDDRSILQDDMLTVGTIGGEFLPGLQQLTATIAQMKATLKDATTQIRCFGELAELGWKNWRNRGSIGKAGGIEAIVGAMSHHFECAQVQSCGCVALYWLASWGNQESIADAGGIERIVLTMRRHVQSEEVQNRACQVLAELVGGHRDSIVRVGGIQAVVVAMRSHLQNEEVQRHACKALAGLASYSPSSQVLIANEGGIDAVILAMTHHLNDEDVQRHGLWTLARLAEANLANQRFITSSGGVEAMIAAMQRHLHNTDLQHVGSRSLARLARDNAVNQDSIARSGGIVAIVSAMRHHKCHDHVQGSCCFALGCLAYRNVNNQRIIGDSKAPDVIREASKRFENNDWLQRCAEYALEMIGIPVVCDESILKSWGGYKLQKTSDWVNAN